MSKQEPPQNNFYMLVAKFTVKPERMDEWVPLFEANQNFTRAQHYCLRSEGMRDGNKFWVNDTFINEAGWLEHNATPAFRKLGAFLQSGGMLEQELLFP
jgi:quinol monooxygenase YgiN